MVFSETKPPLPRDLFSWAYDASAPLWVMHCAEGPVPRRAADAARALLDREERPWTMRWQEDFLDIPARARAEAARIIGGDARDVTLVPTTSAGLGVVAQGFPWRDGDEILAPDGEFPANSWPWKVLAPRGVTVRTVPLWEGQRAGRDAWQTTPPRADVTPEERLAAAIGARTRLVAVSWVRFQDGLRLDLDRLGALCEARGAALVVDGIQGAGTLPLALGRGRVAAFATGGHKGLLGPQGLGFLWTAGAFRAALAPPGGWLSVEDANEFARPSTDLERAFLASGEGLEMGVPNLVGAVALAESLAAINDAGVDAIAGHVATLQRALLDALAARGGWLANESARLAGLLDQGRLGSILAIHHAGRGRAAMDAILKDGFARGIYASVREGYLRIALHGWHELRDVDRLVAWLALHAGR